MMMMLHNNHFIVILLLTLLCIISTIRAAKSCQTVTSTVFRTRKITRTITKTRGGIVAKTKKTTTTKPIIEPIKEPIDKPVSDICESTGFLTGISGPCTNGASCCQNGAQYETFTCSPPVTSATKAKFTINGFGEGQSGGFQASCTGQYHSNSELIVALSTGWFENRFRCGKFIKISANGKTVNAKVVDECDSRNGCDAMHDFQLPCKNNIVDGSSAVWAALGIPENSSLYGYMDVTWSDLEESLSDPRRP